MWTHLNGFQISNSSKYMQTWKYDESNLQSETHPNYSLAQSNLFWFKYVKLYLFFPLSGCFLWHPSWMQYEVAKTPLNTKEKLHANCLCEITFHLISVQTSTPQSSSISVLEPLLMLNLNTELRSKHFLSPCLKVHGSHAKANSLHWFLKCCLSILKPRLY